MKYLRPPASGCTALQVVAPELGEIHLQRRAQQVRLRRARLLDVHPLGQCRHLGRKIHQLAERDHVRVAAEDAFHQRRARARHADDEDRARRGFPRRSLRQRLARIVRHDFLHRIEVVAHVVVQGAALDPVAFAQRRKRFLVLADVLQLLRQGEVRRDRVLLANLRAHQRARRCSTLFFAAVWVRAANGRTTQSRCRGPALSTRSSKAAASSISLR